MLSRLTPSTIKNFYLAGCKVRMAGWGMWALGMWYVGMKPGLQEHPDPGCHPRDLTPICLLKSTNSRVEILNFRKLKKKENKKNFNA